MFQPHQLEIDKQYVPIISSSNGLLRYRIGDIVKVTKIVKRIPYLEFIGRLDKSLSAAGEKMVEAHFRNAVSVLEKRYGYAIGQWVAGIKWKGKWPQYVLQYESDIPYTSISLQIEEILKSTNVSYKRKRDQKLLEPVQTIHRPIGSLTQDPRKMRWFGQTKQQYIFDSTI